MNKPLSKPLTEKINKLNENKFFLVIQLAIPYLSLPVRYF